MSAVPHVGWIGLGRMGAPMVRFILQAGFPVVACTRNAASLRSAVALGASAADGVAACASNVELIFSSLPDDAALRDVALGRGGVLAHARRGTIYADTSTVSPDVADEIQHEATARGIAYLRIPISGNAKQAESGDLTAMVSGPEAAWHAVQPVLKAFSKAQVYLGPGNEALYMKLVANALIVNTAQVMAEALTLGRKAGLEWGAMLDTLGQSAIASRWLKAKLGLMKPRDFSVTMTTRLILKDLDLMLAAARSHEVPMPLTALTRQLMQAVIGAGFGDEDYMATIKLAEQQAGLPIENVQISPEDR